MSRNAARERRKHERVETVMAVHIRVDGQTHRHPAQIVNIGAGGVLMKTSLKMEANESLAIDLDLEGEREPICVYGTVVRADPRGYGVSFVRITPITADLIAYLIRKSQREGVPQS
ncbi:MAG: PilZ domain-containing protein [Candidatus Eremiobacteraeota bacterium]|nr:PilZ domain-containing protein [Candidatus Eremiobacteraeota bacterium]